VLKIMAAKVLIIDDEEGVRKTLSLNLGMEGYEVESVEGRRHCPQSY